VFSNRSSRWCFITAGLTPGPIRDAGNRVAQQAKNLYKFQHIYVVTQDNLRKTCPMVYKKYGEHLNVHSRGFGYYMWKPESVSTVLEGKFGECDGVVWVDGGCEVNVNSISKMSFSWILDSARRHGGWFYQLGTPEENYTKRDLIIRFSDAVSARPSTQVQANFFALHGEKGKSLARIWKEMVLERIENIDFSISENGESNAFIEHRNDQSLLSLIVKSSDIPISKYVPPSRPQSFGGKVKGLASPIWVARNRTGVSILDPKGDTRE
jgi:hypothetical protein